MTEYTVVALFGMVPLAILVIAGIAFKMWRECK